MADIFSLLPKTVECCSGACAWLSIQAVRTKVEFGDFRGPPSDSKSYLQKTFHMTFDYTDLSTLFWGIYTNVDVLLNFYQRFDTHLFKVTSTPAVTLSAVLKRAALFWGPEASLPLKGP